MKKRLKALLMALIMMVSTIITTSGDVVTAKAADDAITVNFHLTKVSTNDYSDYRLWLWTIGDGSEFKMTPGTDEATYSYKTDAATLKVGYIVKKGEGWDHKDFADDRFVDLSEVISGTVDVYIESTKAAVTMNTDAAVKGSKITSASTKDYQNIAVSVSTDQTASQDLFTVINTSDNDSNVAIQSITGSGKTFTITTANKLNETDNYKVIYKGIPFMVGMPDIYGTADFESKYTYTGNDLGATYTKEGTTFKVWAPLATSVKINLYTSGTAGTNDLIGEPVDMTASDKGTWVATIPGDLNGKYYTYTANVNNKEVKDIIDPYARTSGVNGDRGMIIDLNSTNPEGWDKDKNPNPIKNYTDAILYELHIRDFSYEDCSGMVNKGKYLAFTEKGTTNSFGQSTGIDYLKDLGVNFVHLMPTFDYASIDETKLNEDKFNWGYDPQNFNIPEGSYSTDPYKGEVRVKEFKQMVQSLHNAGISVVMDVVYGHVDSATDFSINKLTPNYYTRPNSSASGCGNDTATERAMNRKYIVDSVVYWAKEYHINGFRFDQEGLFDIDTINEVTDALKAIDPSIIVYGEGWNMDSTKVTKDNVKLGNYSNAELTPDSAFFSDSLRDSVKGSVFDAKPGYVTKGYSKLVSLLSGVTATPGWPLAPTQVVNYNSCHDNYSLFDRITITEGNEGASLAQRVKQNNLAAAIAYTSQGIPFMQAGEEILRSKPKGDGTYIENSYSSSSSINSIKWDDINKPEYQSTLNYYKGLIAFRKAHAGLRMYTEKQVEDNLSFILEGDDENNPVIAYTIKGDANGEASDGITVIYNPGDTSASVKLPEGNWGIYVKDDQAGNKLLGTASGTVEVSPTSSMVLVKGNRVAEDGSITSTTQGTTGAADSNTTVKTGDSNSYMMMLITLCVVAGVSLVVIKTRKKNHAN